MRLINICNTVYKVAASQASDKKYNLDLQNNKKFGKKAERWDA